MKPAAMSLLCGALALLLAVPGTRAFAPLRRPLRAPLVRSLVRSSYKVTLNGPDGDQQTIECAPDVNILDAAEQQGVNLPFDCRLGSCVACAGKMVEGTTDNSQQFFLTDELLDMGFILTCASFPTSDCTVESFSADEVNALY